MPGAFGNHATNVLQVLLHAFPSQSDLERLAWFQLDVNLEELTKGHLKDGAEALIRWAVRHGKERALLTAMLAEQPTDVVQALVATVEEHLDVVAPLPWYSSPRPVDACIVRDCAMLDREELRRHMRTMLTPTGTNILSVHGPRHSGRSHSVRLIRHVEAELGTFKVVDITLDDQTGDLRPHDLVRSLAYQLNCGEALSWMPSPDGQNARISHDLVDWFVAQVDQQDLPTWVVVDGMDHCRPREETLELIVLLAATADRRGMRKLRVILLGFPALPPHLDGAVLEDPIAFDERPALIEFFTRFFAHRRERADPDAIERAVDGLLALVGDSPHNRLHRLSRAAARLARQFAEPEVHDG